MEGKLFKMVEGYTLSLTGSIDDLYGITNKQLSEDHGLQKLSLKNCEDVVNGYDLDSILEEHFKTTSFGENGKHVPYKFFKEGFQKAVELLGDKKFSEEDVINLLGKRQKEVDKYWFYNLGEHIVLPTNEEWLKTQLLKQTEWDVEIEIEDLPYSKELSESEVRGFEEHSPKSKKPKLDSNGCLILKRK